MSSIEAPWGEERKNILGWGAAFGIQLSFSYSREETIFPPRPRPFEPQGLISNPLRAQAFMAMMER